MFATKSSTESDPIGHVTSPMIVGGSIIALKCKQGVIIANDTLLSYGSLLKYPDVNRVQKLTENIAMTATGQYADFQEVTRRMNEMTRESDSFDDNISFGVEDYANYLSKICYAKRNDQNPYFNSFVVAGFENGQSHLASVDMYGSYIKNNHIALGFAKHFGLALIANEWNPDMTYEECKVVLKKCFSIIYMRVCHSIDSVQFTFVGKDGVKIFPVEKVDSTWDFKDYRERKNEKLWQ